MLQIGHAKAGEDAFDDAPAGGPRIAAYYLWLWPNLMMNVYPWGFSVNVVKPLAVDRTRVAFLTWVTDPARLDRGAGAGLHDVELEDEAVVESVMQGTTSRLYGRGRYSPDPRGRHPPLPPDPRRGAGLTPRAAVRAGRGCGSTL